MGTPKVWFVGTGRQSEKLKKNPKKHVFLQKNVKSYIQSRFWCHIRNLRKISPWYVFFFGWPPQGGDPVGWGEIPNSESVGGGEACLNI